MRGGRQFQRDAGEVARHLLQRQLALTPRRIGDPGMTAGQAAQDDVVIQGPVQDGGALKLFQLVQIAAQGTSGEPQRVCNGDEGLEAGPAEGDREAAAEFGQGLPVTVCGGDHGDAGEAAFGGFGLQCQLISH
jgi:hypothetical protein